MAPLRELVRRFGQQHSQAGLRDVMREVAEQWRRLAADADAKERYVSN